MRTQKETTTYYYDTKWLSKLPKPSQAINLTDEERIHLIQMAIRSPALCNEESPAGWKGTVRAMLAHHPDKFSKHACKEGGKDGKICPYALAWAEKHKGDEPHYKDQKSSLKGKPKKKEKFKNESVTEMGFAKWLREQDDRTFWGSSD